MRFYKRTAAAFFMVIALMTIGADTNRDLEETGGILAVEQQMEQEHLVQFKDTVRIYENIPLTAELQKFTYNLCREKCLDYEMVLAIMQKESNYDPKAVSATDDYGIMQINRCNHNWLREEIGITDFLDAKESITAGTEILGRLAAKYSRDSDAVDPHQILMAYNMGETGAQKAWSAGIMTSAYSRAVMEIRAEILKGGTT